MGKKDKSKKGKGAEKTAAKTEKKLTAKQKKELAAIGEEDIEQIVAAIEREESLRVQVVEHSVGPPSRRVNFSFVSHPEREELFLFGGEYFNGQKTFVYNDLFVYNIPKSEWTLLKAPACAPPRCGHQMVAVAFNKGQLWVFGGEFASPTQSQFYHYKDLWVFHIAEKKWEKINAANAPSSRSGHRMVHTKRHLIVFGGFHDNLRDYKYLNDVHAFDLDNYTWKKITTTGTPPSPRSGCQMLALPDGKIIISGGYSKECIKKDVDKGTVHTDMFLLSPDKHDDTFTKWKWQTIKPSGVRISPRCGMTLACGPAGKAYAFGGVFDVEEDEEDIAGTFYNDLYVLDPEKHAWRTLTLVGKKEANVGKKRRRKAKENDDGEKDDSAEESDGDEEMDESPQVTTISEDGVFKVTLGPSQKTEENKAISEGSVPNLFTPCPRMNCGLTVKHGVLYLYGGMVEEGDRQITLSDFYALDVHKLDEWKVLIPNDQSTEEWLASGSEDSSEDDTDSDDSGDGAESNDAMDIS